MPSTLQEQPVPGRSDLQTATPFAQVQSAVRLDKERRIYSVALLAVLAAILIPIWMVDYPGMVDYPNHLTRCYIIAHYYENPVWQQRYFLVYDPIPNLAIDLVVVPLLHFFPLLVCGKLFLSLAATLYVVGCSAVGRAATGKPNWLALVCAFTFYNSQLLFGFVNFVFGIGVFLCAFAFWLRVRSAMTPLRFFLCCMFSVAAFFSHLSSAAFLGIACVTVALLDLYRERQVIRFFVNLVWLFTPLLLMAGYLGTSGQVGGIEWSTPMRKLLLLLAPIRTYSVAFDLGLILVLFLCALTLRRDTSIHRTALVSLVFFALFLITPKNIYTTSGADARYVVPGYLLLILSVELRGGRLRKMVLAVALTAMAARTVSITANWLAISQRGKQALAMGDVLPQGARIYVMAPTAQTDVVEKQDRGFIHLIQFWTISHNADLSSLFALPGQQPLVFRETPCDGPNWAACLSRYDYVWTNDPPPSIRQTLLDIAKPASVWESLTLWRVTAPTVRAAK